MNLINLDVRGKLNYSADDVVKYIASKMDVTETEAERLVQSGEGIPESTFHAHPIIIGKSFGEIVALHIHPRSGKPALYSKWFTSGWPIAIATPGESDTKVRKAKHGRKQMHPLYQEIMRKLKDGQPVV